MPTKRMIDPEFWQSESMAELSREERLFFIGLISNADDQGRLKAHPALLRSQIYPYDDDVTTEMIGLWLEAVAAVESAFVYAVGDKTHIQIIKWWSYQSPQWAYPSKIPAPQGWQDKLKYRKNNKVIMTNWDGDGGFSQAEDAEVIDYTHLGKALPKAQGKALDYSHSIDESSIELDINPKGLAEKSAETLGPKTQVKEDFEEIFKLKFPTAKKTQKFWWYEFQVILDTCSKDPATAKKHMLAVKGYVDENELTVTGPKSIEGLINTSVSGQLNGAKPNERKGPKANSTGKRSTSGNSQRAGDQDQPARADRKVHSISL